MVATIRFTTYSGRFKGKDPPTAKTRSLDSLGPIVLSDTAKVQIDKRPGGHQQNSVRINTMSDPMLQIPGGPARDFDPVDRYLLPGIVSAQTKTGAPWS